MLDILNKLIPWDEFRQLIHLMRKKTFAPGKACISLNAESVSCAYVIRDPNEKPKLVWCENIPNTDPKKIPDILRDLVKEKKAEHLEFSWLLDPHDFKVLTVETLPVPASEMISALTWRIKDLIDFPITEAVIDYFPSFISAVGKPNNLNVIVARKNYLQNKISLFNSLSINVTTIDIPQLALRNITSLFPEDKKGIALLWLKPYESTFLITKQSILYLARYIDLPIPDTLNPNDANTESLLSNLSLEVQRSLDYYSSQLRQELPARILIASPQKAIYDYLSQRLTNTPEILDLQSILQISSEQIAAAQLCLSTIGGTLRQEENHGTTS